MSSAAPDDWIAALTGSIPPRSTIVDHEIER